MIRKNTEKKTENKGAAEGITYRLVRSRRRTLAMEIRDGELIVRAPLRCSGQDICSFIKAHRSWILKHMSRSEACRDAVQEYGALTEADIKRLKDEAGNVIPERVRHYADIMGVSYGRISIRSQSGRWGSCSAKGSLSFNCLLMMTPPEVLDSVVVHELCHLKEMNHSDRFYREVLKYYPDYHACHRWLKENGEVLIKRMKAGKSTNQENIAGNR
ncbi:MAG: M48 family metallopeptidase [Parasporobacterium sp.]|nr:M48 family metallopeptidase [Parasporobacterium sp.]